jgi:hypothetical protein
MSYRLECAGSSYEINTGQSQSTGLVRLIRQFDGSTTLELLLRSTDLIGRVGLRSPVRLWSNGTQIFTGQIFRQELFADSVGSGKRIFAAGPLDWCETIDLLDEAGIAKLQFSQTTVGEILQGIFTRQGATMRSLDVAGNSFYEAAALTNLKAPIDHLWLENRDLKSVICELLTMGNYALAIDPETLAWQIRPIDELDLFELDLRTGSSLGIVGYRVVESTDGRYSAIRLVGDRDVEITYASATPAWDTSLESQWQLRHSQFADPDDDEPDVMSWVFRRFSYAAIDDLVEHEPVELVQNVPTENGGVTWQVVETLPLDRTGKYLIAKMPVLATPRAKTPIGKNAFRTGQVEAGEVAIRYRRYRDEPEISVRCPSSGFSGQILETAGLAREHVIYLSDSRQITQSRAERLWQQGSKLGSTVELNLSGPIQEELFVGPRRVKLRVTGNGDLSQSDWFVPQRLEYDFSAGRLMISLKRL